MVEWGNLLGGGARQGERDHQRSLLLPTRRQNIPSAFPPQEVTKVALRLKLQLEKVVPCEMEEDLITAAHSGVITPKVVETAMQAGGEEYKGCVVYSLLVCNKWFKRQAILELWDADLHNVRAAACEVIAKRIIESQEDEQFLFEELLLKRFSIIVDGEQSVVANALERAVDLHALRVIGSSGYQKCVSYLWRGWLVQDEEDPTRFVPYQDKINTNYWVHVDPDRMRVPRYQNALQIIFSVAYLALYTGAINTINPTGDLDIVEGLMYIFTLGFICDEIAKFWKVGRYYIGFWNVFNSTLYTLVTVSFVMRMIALGKPLGDHERKHFNELSYNFLAFTAPMFWMRLLLYLDTFQFFGAMLVVVKVMMKESLIFFALLIVVMVGFLQGFIGLDSVDQELSGTKFVLKAMANAIMQSPDFDGFEKFSPPFGLVLYYIFTFIIMVVLLNILIALYNSAYEDITQNAIDEYLALFAQKAMQFVRAPDENVFIPPLNLVEIFLLVLPFEWWMPRQSYERLNDIVMGVFYSPLLLVTAFIEQHQAKYIRDNRRRGETDDDTVEEWEQLEYNVSSEDTKWVELVEKTSPDILVNSTQLEVRELKAEVAELKEMLKKLLQNDSNGGPSTGEGTKGTKENLGFGLSST